MLPSYDLEYRVTVHTLPGTKGSGGGVESKKKLGKTGPQRDFVRGQMHLAPNHLNFEALKKNVIFHSF